MQASGVVLAQGSRHSASPFKLLSISHPFTTRLACKLLHVGHVGGGQPGRMNVDWHRGTVSVVRGVKVGLQ